MLIKALLVGIILGLCKNTGMLGYGVISRPIIVGTLTGLVLGDPVQGLIVGAAMELIFIGSFPVGAAVSPDYTSATAIGAALGILSGGGVGVATALALPVALLGGFIFIGVKILNSFGAEIMKKEIRDGNEKALAPTYLAIPIVTTFLIYALYGFLAVFAGGPAVETLVSHIPTGVINGLTAAGNMLPAIGFALLMGMTVTKKLVPFFFIGFFMVSYLGMSTIAIVLFAVMIVLVMLSRDNAHSNAAATIGGYDDNEF